MFFKPFSGGGTNGLATGAPAAGQPGTPGVTIQLTGWAGAEANALMEGAEFAIDFLNGGGGVIVARQSICYRRYLFQMVSRSTIRSTG